MPVRSSRAAQPLSPICQLRITRTTPSVGGVGSEFTRQGKLDLLGSPLNADADFEFTFWDADAAGNMIGSVAAVGFTIMTLLPLALFANVRRRHGLRNCQRSDRRSVVVLAPISRRVAAGDQADEKSFERIYRICGGDRRVSS